MSRKKSSRQVRWKSIVEELSGQVGLFSYGSRFFTIKEICEKFSVSSITARRVLSEMERKGLVERKQKTGTIVRQLNRPVKIRWIIYDSQSISSMLQNYVFLRVYAGVAASAQKMQIDFDTIPLNYFAENKKGLDKHTGYFIFHEILPEISALVRQAPRQCVVLHSVKSWPNLVSVRTNMKEGFKQAVRHLIQAGHRRIACITGPIASPWHLPRFQGYQESLEESRIPFEWRYVKETSGNNAEEDALALAEILEERVAPTAVIAGNDRRAIHVMECCQKRGIKVPEDLSIVGYDNIPASLYTQPPLTTIEPHLWDIGQKGVQVLCELMTSPPAKSFQDVWVNQELIIRGTVRRVKTTKQVKQ